MWSDASYSHWLDSAWDGCLSESTTRIELLVRKWDKPHMRANNFVKSTDTGDRVNYIVLDRKVYRHGDIGNNALILSSGFDKKVK